MKKRTYCIIAATLLASSTLTSSAASGFQEGWYLDKYYQLSGSIVENRASTSLQYQGGGLVSIDGTACLQKGNYILEFQDISAAGTGKASRELKASTGRYIMLDAQAYIRGSYIDAVHLEQV